MDDKYIKKDDAFDVACAECEAGTFYDIPSKIMAIPSADVVERKHGKWENTLQGWKCSACQKEQDYSVFFNYCPNCGARMDCESDDYERPVEQMEYDMFYEPTYNPKDGSM